MIAGVPYDAEIEYLESTGTQYITIPLRPSSNCVITADFLYTEHSQYGAIFGGGDGNLVKEILFARGSSINQAMTYRCGNGQNYQTIPSFALNERKTIIWYKDGMTIGDTAWTNLTNSNSFSATRNYIGLFCSLRYGSASPIFLSKGRLFSAYLSDGESTYDLIPVRVGSVGYMYDRVSRRLFGNVGTGAFVLGPDVATPVMGLRRYPQSRLGKMGARHMIYGGN